MGVGRICPFGGDWQFVFFPDDQANKRLFRFGRSWLFGYYLCDGMHLDCCTCFELASKIRINTEITLDAKRIMNLTNRDKGEEVQ